MSQTPPQSSAEILPEAPQRKAGGPLRVVLIVVMFVMLGLFGWDQYARATSNGSYEKVVKLKEESTRDQTPEDVQKLLGRRPDRPLEDHQDYALETYSWRRGILIQSYFVKVIYRKEGGKVHLHEVVQNIEPTDNDLPNPPVEILPPAAKSGEGDAASQKAGATE